MLEMEIENLTLQELIELHLRYLWHKKIVKLVKEKNKMEILKESTKFGIGDKVSFDHIGKIITGEIMRINQRAISIKSECAEGIVDTDPRLVKKIYLQENSESVKIQKN